MTESSKDNLPETEAARSTAPSRQISTKRKIVYSSLVVIIFIAIPELFLRITEKPNATSSEPNVGTRQFVSWLSNLSVGLSGKEQLYVEDESLIWRLRAGVKIDSFNFHHAPNGEEQAIQITVNDQGYRGAKGSQKRDVLRVLCMGDSNFFGYPLDDKAVFPQALQRELEQQYPDREIEVINGGCPGYTIVQGLAWFESTFEQYEFDFLLLSYLNNDAWRQPYSDRQLMQQGIREDGAFLKAASQLAVVRWLRARSDVSPEDYVSRVSLEDFEQHYRNFLKRASDRDAKVIIVDHRAYPEYEPFSRVLSSLVSSNIKYIPVREQLTATLKGPESLQPYKAMMPAIEKRWGKAALAERPYLWFYAEFYPEHLNELGAQWLGKNVAREIQSYELTAE
ncbi:MAG: hypothetical protein CMJ78_25170 [Planctomycetaceae bacterium]|nr:hypothetical protein [Planctomycetaceae bacterium]